MARVDSSQYPEIARLLKEHIPVSNIAQQFGCTAANIYAIKRTKLGSYLDTEAVPSSQNTPIQSHDNQGNQIDPDTITGAQSAHVTQDSALQDIPDPINTEVLTQPVSLGSDSPMISLQVVENQIGSVEEPKEEEKEEEKGIVVSSVSSGMEKKVARSVATRPQPVAAAPKFKSSAKQMFGLYMRSAQGDETMQPFRSLEDLLTVIKPLLRRASGEEEAVWFSIQPIDSSDMEEMLM